MNEDLFDAVDPRLSASLRNEWERRRTRATEPLPRGVTIALVGHRAAGKTSLLPAVARLLGKEGVDLDTELARRAGRSLAHWVTEDEPGFRSAERACFQSLPRGSVVACGGGFLASHPGVLRGGCVSVLVPITLETYFERLRADPSRPRLHPELSYDEELRQVWFEREELHRRARTSSLVDLLLASTAGRRPLRVVTLPPAVNPRDFAFRARRLGAELLEVRTDLIDPETDLGPAARALPLLVAERERPAPASWRPLAETFDAESGSAQLRSHHASRPLTPDEAEAVWRDLPPGIQVKHVEPLGPPAGGWRLLETQRRLQARFGEDAVTVLATGTLALPFRAVLARNNALDYLALDSSWSAAPGQRLVIDAAREARAGLPRRPRLGILGHDLERSRSPSIHPQPFDRIDLPPDTELGPLLEALLPHYKGFAVTSPFKTKVLGSRAVNTLWRTGGGYLGNNCDLAGALTALEGLEGTTLTVLGSGGVAEALGAAAEQRGIGVQFIKRAQAGGRHLEGFVVWAWPPHVEPPEGLRLDHARVGVLSYGARAHLIGRKIRGLGGQPIWLGSRWFVAQARAQRVRWEGAT